VKPSFIVARAVLALVLMVGFYALALGIAFGLFWVPYAEVVYAHHITGKLAVVCIAGGATILWAVLPRRDKFTAPGPLLEQAKYPRLFEALEGIARATRQAMPREVYLVPDVNAWVSQRGGLMGFGSRRVMGLGLPLMRILTRSQFSAVLAHEFGHYHGGDTRIGPWIYKTRAAIGRTLASLGHSSWLQAPFRWYGQMFLRITHAVSRRQEFIADELAARTVGAKPLADGLRSVHKVAPAFDAYWHGEYLPVFSAGFLPPLAEGFDQFVKAHHIAEQMDRHLEDQLASAGDPYDTHPPLKDRIAAITGLPDGPSQPQDPPALSLLEDVSALERELAGQFAGAEYAAGLQAIVWGDVGAQVYLPIWTKLVQANAGRLAGLTPQSLGTVATDPHAFGKTLVQISHEPPDDESAAGLANAVTGAALALLLVECGGALRFTPGSDISVGLRGQEVKPFGVLSALNDGGLTAEAWTAQCLELGIVGSGLAVAAPAGDGADSPAGARASA
jgi:heat shock protein HtpX